KCGGAERAVGGDAVLAVPGAVPMGSEPATVADGVPWRLCGSGGPGAGGLGALPAVEREREAAAGMWQRGGGRGGRHVVGPPPSTPTRPPNTPHPRLACPRRSLAGSARRCRGDGLSEYLRTTQPKLSMRPTLCEKVETRSARSGGGVRR